MTSYYNATFDMTVSKALVGRTLAAKVLFAKALVVKTLTSVYTSGLCIRTTVVNGLDFGVGAAAFSSSCSCGCLATRGNGRALLSPTSCNVKVYSYQAKANVKAIF